jgi:hypothetical protein
VLSTKTREMLIVKTEKCQRMESFSTNGETENREIEFWRNRERNSDFFVSSRTSTAIVCRISLMLHSLFLQNSISWVCFLGSRFFYLRFLNFLGLTHICLSPVLRRLAVSGIKKNIKKVYWMLLFFSSSFFLKNYIRIFLNYHKLR